MKLHEKMESVLMYEIESMLRDYANKVDDDYRTRAVLIEGMHLMMYRVCKHIPPLLDYYHQAEKRNSKIELGAFFKEAYWP